MATPRQTDPQFKLRLPAALKEIIDAAAAENNRSLNAEIVHRLEQYEEHRKADRLRSFFEEGRQRQVRELERQNEGLKARLTRLYQEADARFDDFSPNQLSTIKRLANDEAHQQIQMVLSRLEGQDPTGIIKAERERLETEHQERIAQK